MFILVKRLAHGAVLRGVMWWDRGGSGIRRCQASGLLPLSRSLQPPTGSQVQPPALPALSLPSLSQPAGCSAHRWWSRFRFQPAESANTFMEAESEMVMSWMKGAATCSLAGLQGVRRAQGEAGAGAGAGAGAQLCGSQASAASSGCRRAPMCRLPPTGAAGPLTAAPGCFGSPSRRCRGAR